MQTKSCKATEMYLKYKEAEEEEGEEEKISPHKYYGV